VNKDVKQQTMADLFQEVFNPTNMEVAMLPLSSTGYNPELLQFSRKWPSGCLWNSAYFSFCSVAGLVIMEECNRSCRWKRIGMQSS